MGGEKRGKGEGDGAVLWLPTPWAVQTAVSESKKLCSIQALFCQKSLFVRKPSHNIWLVVCGCVCMGSLSVSLSLCLSLSLSVSLCLSLSLSVSLCLSVSLSVSQSVNLSLYVCLSVCLSVCLFVCLRVWS